jgi:hypothetical protein
MVDKIYTIEELDNIPLYKLRLILRDMGGTPGNKTVGKIKEEIMDNILKLNIQSEIGQLEGVILHSPGAEVENMTPGNAQRALYSDILNLSIAQNEYVQLLGVLGKYTRTYQVMDLLERYLRDYRQKEVLVGRICIAEHVTDYFDDLMAMDSATLAKSLIEGVPAKINSFRKICQILQLRPYAPLQRN